MINLGTVLGLAALPTSPALYRGFVTGELPVDVALTRYLVAVVAVWVALSLLAGLVGPSTPAPVLAVDEADTPGAAGTAEATPPQ
ncbi:hypothetical protein G5V58_06400 [Nocardioides anomalus]|uniref:Uncharacterized protein n=1 Tax=Nocardioides anomalus TaxID=2712223 RepID=A0A6G6WB61_9ACTN|nr:hypothetical protein [Nocardioides anomalus]QIG42449.1 hypothetical protein G5V58_06400 [Nocardioides anomalus]